MSLFTGREGVFANQWIDEWGRSGYHPVNRPLTREDIKLHLEGQSTLGLYITRLDNTVKLALIDIDISKKLLQKDNSEKQDTSVDFYKLVLSDATRIVNLLLNLGISVWMENSGWKGIHCWIFFEQPIRAKEIRIFLKEILKKVGPPPPQINREIFPKQDFIEKEKLGSLVKLPLGIHKMTQRRSLFIDMEGKTYENQIAFLWKINTIKYEIISKAFSKLRLVGQETQENVLDP